MSELLNNRYQVVSVLGEGAFGKTFLAEDVHMPSRRRCVIKQLKPIIEPAQYNLVKERFQREAAILEHLGELTNQVPKLYAYFATNDLFYLVQEWIEGKTLGQVSFAQKKLNERIVKDLTLNLLIVLDSVHSQNIIHRDIKPDNIIIRQRDGKPCLIDFGIVKEVIRIDVFGHPTSSIIAGTPAFMAPEQAAGRPVFASDLYSLGMTAICLLTGKPLGNMIDRLTGDVKWHPFAERITPEFAKILDKATEPNFRDRYKTAKEMQEALQPPSASLHSTNQLQANQSANLNDHSTIVNQKPPGTPVSNQARNVIPVNVPKSPKDLSSSKQINASPTAALAKKRLPLKLGVAVVIIMAAIVLAVLVWSQREKTDSPKLLTIDLELVKPFNSNSGVHVLGFSPDEKLLAIGTGNGNEGEVDIHTILAGEKIQSFNIGYVRSIAFSPDGKLIAIAADNAGTVIYDLNTGDKIKSLKGKTNVSSISFSKDGIYLGIAALYETYIYDVKTFGQLVYFKTKTYDSQISFDPNGKSFLIANSEGIFTYDLPTGNPLNSSPPNWRAVNSVSQNPDGKFLAIGTLDSTILYDIAKNKPTKLYDGFTDCVDFSPNGDFLVITTESKGAMIFNIQTGQKVKSILNEGEGGTYAAQFSPKGNYLVINGNRKALLYGVQWKEIDMKAAQ